MRIGIEAQRIFRPRKHGMDMVALELIRNLQTIDHENEYVIFVKPDTDRDVLQETHNFRIVELKGGPYPWWEQVALPRAARHYGCDVLHCTSNTAPVFCSVPLLLTLHDIIYMERSALQILRGKGSAYQRSGNIYRRWVVPYAFRKSRKVITVSKFEKERITQFFHKQNSERVQAIYNGVGDYFKPVTNEQERTRIRQQYNLPERYFFFLGNTDPKKNTKTVLKAVADYLQQTGEQIKLVMVDYDKQALLTTLEENGDSHLLSSIVLTGYVNNKDLPAIYAMSEIFLYPSLRESFGIPIIEAMACGVPVITSSTSSMPEVAGDAALLVDPASSAQITEAIKRIMNEPDLRNTLVQKGLVQAAGFSWKRMAEEVLSVYQSFALNDIKIHPAKA